MTFDWHNPYATFRSPLFARNVVATSHALASQAGVRMLLNGGNAVHAIISAAALTAPPNVACSTAGTSIACWIARRTRTSWSLGCSTFMPSHV